MAVKGKKKSRNRGSQARRRPGAAPRPVPVARHGLPWYGTLSGRLIGGALVVLLIGLVIWAVSNSRSDSADLASRQEELNDYTTDVRGLIQNLAIPTSEMATAGDLPDGRLKERTQAWNDGFSAAQTQLSQTASPDGLGPANQLLLQSILEYVAAANTYELSLDVSGRVQQRLQTQANVQWSNANAVFGTAIVILDSARKEAELGETGLTPPGLSQPAPQPTPQPTSAPGGSGGSGGGNKGNGSGGGKKSGGKKNGGKGNG